MFIVRFELHENHEAYGKISELMLEEFHDNAIALLPIPTTWLIDITAVADILLIQVTTILNEAGANNISIFVAEICDENLDHRGLSSEVTEWIKNRTSGPTSIKGMFNTED